jgi:outer membrane protein assembly factor BamB
VLGGSPALGSEATAQAREILNATGVKGGLVVHVGCGDGVLTAALRANERFLVQGLEADTAKVEAARAHVQSLGLHGPVSVDIYDGTRLPYADNLVNLAVIADGTNVPREEVLRVLAPGGAACSREKGRWRTLRKPWPKGMDGWTHFLHGPDGNAVAADRIVGPPRHVQLMDGPLWSRHHDTVPSVNALVSAGGRIIYMVDEAPPAIGGTIPDQWALAARDAFNGVLLWKRPVKHWGWRAWSGTWKGRFNQPNNVPKRLVAVGDRVYGTLGFNAPLTQLDAATGETLKTYAGTEYTDEVLYHNDTLILSINHGPQEPGTAAEKPPVKKSVAVVDPETGRMLWKTGSYVGTSSKTGSVERVSHLLLAARGDGVFLADRDALVAIDLKTGEERWTAPRPEHKRYTSRYHHLMSDLCTLVATDDVILFAQLEPVQKRIGWGVIKTGLYAFDVQDGERRWSRVVGNWGHFCVPDVFVINGRVWVHDYKSMSMIGLHPRTGHQEAKISTDPWFKQGHHHRCYRNKATERYILTGYRGVEFIRVAEGTMMPHHWSRGACRYGILPCNGLLYSTPHPCECYIKAKLNGLYALAPARDGAGPAGEASADGGTRLEKGPAYGAREPEREATKAAFDWPTYRHDGARSGATAAEVPTKLETAWDAEMGAKLSPPVIAGGKVIVSAIDAQIVHALDAATGERLWSRAVGGRVDSPPTVHQGQVLFGCADGWVYALRAADGALAWRLRAAPAERRVVTFGRLESAWPVHGSVLVRDGTAHVAAGRSSYLDGGITVCSVEPATGKLLSRTRIYSPDPETGLQPPQHGRQKMPGALSDILVGTDEGVFLRHLKVDGEEEAVESTARHLLSTAGFLDASWFNRTAWTLGRVAGRILCFDEETVYGVAAYGSRNRSGFFFPGKGYRLFAVRQPNAEDRRKKPKRPARRWDMRVPIRVRGMVLADDRLVVAGPPDVVPDENPWAAFEGNKGGVLWTVDCQDGAKLAERELASVPVFDGMAAARGRLYICTTDGKVLCMAGAK